MTSKKYIERLSHIENLLLIQHKVIDTNALRDACAFGVPELLRPLCWRLFLGLLQKERVEWPSLLERRRREYYELVENLTTEDFKTNLDDPAANGTQNAGDHPLNDQRESEWNRYFKDNEVLVQIHKDVRRMRPEIDFFQRYTNYPLKNYARLSKRINSEELVAADKQEKSTAGGNIFDAEEPTASKAPAEEEEEKELHWQVVERILYIYSKLNPGIKYIQGMNEIVAPIYFVFGSDPDPEWSRHAEADSFFCFQNLCSEIKDNFQKELDTSNCGIESTLSNFYQLLECVDSELYEHLKQLDIKPQFYAFRWISLLLSQEFSLPDLITLWDAILASHDRIETTLNLGLAMLLNIREELLAGDFAQCVRLLQNYPDVDVSNLMARAQELRNCEKTRQCAAKPGGTKRERFSVFFNGAKERLTSYANNARRQWNKSDGNIVYRP